MTKKTLIIVLSFLGIGLLAGGITLGVVLSRKNPPNPDHEHELVHFDYKEPTCVENGNIEYWYCQTCSHYFNDDKGNNEISYQDTIIAALNHDIKHILPIEPQCSLPGNIEYWKCDRCGVCYDDANHTHEIDISKVAIAPTGHLLDKIDAKESSCTQDGNITYWKCSKCHSYFGDPEGKNEITFASTILEAKGHIMIKTDYHAPTCKEDGNIAYWYCDECNKYFSDSIGVIQINAEDTIIDKTGHQHISHVDYVAPTETTTGIIEHYECDDCGACFEDEHGQNEITRESTIIPSLDHNLVHYEAHAATCLEDGNIEYWKCTRCNKYYFDSEGQTEITYEDTVIEPTGHSLNHVDRKDATCLEDGNIEYWHCSKCDKYYTDETAINEVSATNIVIPKLNHNLVHHEAHAATCLEDGNIEYWKCVRCNKYYSDSEGKTEISEQDIVISKIAHTLAHTSKKEATCLEDGNIEYWKCDECNKYFSDSEGQTEITYDDTVIHHQGHNLTKVDAKNPTCTEDGNIEYWHCSKCNKYYTDETAQEEIKEGLSGVIISRTGHSLTPTEAHAPTCKEDGNIAYWYCDKCDKYFSDSEGQTEIAYEDTIIDKTGHQHIIHVDYVAPTETTTGIIEHYECDDCGACFEDEHGQNEITRESTIIPSLDHNLVHHEAHAATCLEDGNIEYWKCARCNKYYSDSEGKTEISEQDLVIPKIDHDINYVPEKDPTYEDKGNEEYYYCSYEPNVYYKDDQLSEKYASKPELSVLDANGYTLEVSKNPTLLNGYFAETIVYNKTVTFYTTGASLTNGVVKLTNNQYLKNITPLKGIKSITIVAKDKNGQPCNSGSIQYGSSSDMLAYSASIYSGVKISMPKDIISYFLIYASEDMNIQSITIEYSYYIEEDTTVYAVSPDPNKVVANYSELIKPNNFPIYFKYNGNPYYTFNGFRVDQMVSFYTGNNGAIKTLYTVSNSNISQNVKFRVEATLYPNEKSYEYTAFIDNNGTTDTSIFSDIGYKISIKGNDAYLKNSIGDGILYNNGYSPRGHDLSNGSKVSFQSTSGRPTHSQGTETFPYYNLVSGGVNGKSGQFIAIGWSGTWKSSFQYNPSTKITTVEASQYLFNTPISAETTVRLPMIGNVEYSNCNDDEQTNAWRHYFINDVMHQPADGRSQTWLGTCRMGANTNEAESILHTEIISDLDLGIDFFWMDAGWYFGSNNKTTNTNWPQTGNLNPDTTRYPSEFENLGILLEQEGQEFCLWFEPERVGISREAYVNVNEGAKLDFFLSHYEKNFWLSGTDNSLLNLGNKECVEWLSQAVGDVIEKAHVTVYRQDFNIDPAIFWTEEDKLLFDGNCKGLTENLYIQGYYQYWDNLLARFPNLIIDSCASGGGRNDLETMRRSVPFHYTDYFDNLHETYQIYETSSNTNQNLFKWFPCFKSEIYENSLYACRINYAALTQYSAIYPLDKGFDIDLMQEVALEYHTINKYFYDDYYVIADYVDNDPSYNTKRSNINGWMFVNDSKEEGFISVSCLENTASLDHNVKLKGLDPNKTYQLYDFDGVMSCTKTGLELMTSGLDVHFLEKPWCSIITFIAI